MDWQEISSAPRDGTVIEVCALGNDREGPFRMRWDTDRVNPLVGTHAGLWACPFGNFTWDESRGFGPTHWRPCYSRGPAMAMTMRDRCLIAMTASKAWPAIFKSGSAEVLLDAVLAELETPTDGMVDAALVARYSDWGEAQYTDPDDARVIDGMRLALAASAKAAREGK